MVLQIDGELRKIETLVSKKGSNYYKLYLEQLGSDLPFNFNVTSNIITSLNTKLEKGVKLRVILDLDKLWANSILLLK